MLKFEMLETSLLDAVENDTATITTTQNDAENVCIIYLFL